MSSRRQTLRIAVLVAVALLVPQVTVAETTTVNVENSAPTVLSVTLPASTINPTSGSTTAVTTTIVIEDLNGCSDIKSVTLEVLKPDGSTTHVAAASATYQSCAAGTSATYSHTFNMNYHDAAALLTNTYKVKVVATDSQAATGSNVASLAVFNYSELAALSLNLSTIDLGSSIAPNSTTNATGLGVLNHGNVRIDVQLSGTALAHATEAASIGVGNIEYSTASNMSGAAALTASATALAAFDLAAGSGSSSSLYWRVNVPSGDNQWVPSGNYTGTLTVSAVKG